MFIILVCVDDLTIYKLEQCGSILSHFCVFAFRFVLVTEDLFLMQCHCEMLDVKKKFKGTNYAQFGCFCAYN